MAAKKIVPLRPKKLFIGSESQPALQRLYVRAHPCERGRIKKYVTHNKQIAIYGQELTNPMSQEFDAQVPAAVHADPESGMPNAVGNERLAPFEPVTRHQLIVP